MGRYWGVVFVCLLTVGLTGCTALVDQLKEDSAIVGTTGFSISIGFDPAPENAMFPLPKVKMVHGTAWRVGIHDCVYVSTAAGATAYIPAVPTAQKPAAGAGAQKSSEVVPSADGSPGAPSGQDGAANSARGNLASCIPTVIAQPGQNPGGAGGAGQAYLTIAADGLSALKAKRTWVAGDGAQTAPAKTEDAARLSSNR